MVNRRTTTIPFTFIVLAFAFVTCRLFYVQIWNHEILTQRVNKLIFRERPEQPCRGTIYDRSGRILAMSTKTYSIFADCSQIRDLKAVEDALRAEKISFDAAALRENPRNAYVPLASGLDLGAMQRIKALKLAGLGFTSQYQRQYPEGKLACHLLGVVGREGAGLEGIELQANAFLSGEKVNMVRRRDGKGREIADRLTDPDEFRGADVSLTIDRNIQFIAEQEIDRAWKESRAKRAMAIVQDPTTGEILAMASRPEFDPADFSGANLKNPAVSDTFEPGSTFKLVTAAAALEEKVITPGESIWCENGKYPVYGHTIKDHEPKGFLTLDGILECSSNIGTAKVGQRIGKEKLYEYIRQFGFYSPSGIELPGETRGLLKAPAQWSMLSLPIISFGQEIGVTALQLINAYSAIANGGNLMEPRIMRDIKSGGGQMVKAGENRVIRRVVSPQTAARMREMLQHVVERGTGQMAKVPGYTVGGKTGTAQKRDPVTRRYSAQNYVASFCGVIPLSQPRLTVFVVLDEPQGDYWASSRAAPVFSRIAGRAVQYLQIAPDAKPPATVCVGKRSIQIMARTSAGEE